VTGFEGRGWGYFGFIPSVFERNSKTLLRWSPWSWITSPNSSLLTTVPLHAKSYIIVSYLNLNSKGWKYLLQSFQNTLLIIFCGNTLDCCQSLTTVALLNTDMDVVLETHGLISDLKSRIYMLGGVTYSTRTGGWVVACIGERIKFV